MVENRAPEVVIAGAGSGGLEAVQKLAEVLVHITRGVK